MTPCARFLLRTRRLKEAHLLWHQTLDKYQEPDAFRANLNATIQALRNVTFALQAEKRSVPDFDAWYQQWRTRLGDDRAAKWLIDARNLVVKQGDLEISSSARIRVLTWKDDLLIEGEAPPGAPNSLILNNLGLFEMLRQSAIPRSELKHAALAIERRWSVAALDGQELLEALAHVYGLLSALILDVHTKVGNLSCIPLRSTHPDFLSIHSRTGMLQCMAIGAEKRTERIQLATGTSYRVYRERPPDSPELLDTAARRYGLDGMERLPGWQISDPVAVAEKVLYRAKTLLRKDKHHARMMFIRDGHGHWHHTLLIAEDRTEKHILMRVVASFIESVGADALIDVSEAWTLPQEAISELQHDIANIETAPSRGEALKLVVATRDGVLRNYTTPFSRGPLGGIKLGDTRTSENVDEAYYLAPVFEVWSRQGVRTTKTGDKVRWLWEPDPLDRCYCGGTRRFVECCQPHLERARSSKPVVEDALAAGNADLAEKRARAALAQYVIWIKQHTAGTRHVAGQLHRDLISVDVPAVHVHIRHFRDALAANGHLDKLKPALQRLVSVVGVPEIAVRLRALVATELWNEGNVAAATAEIRKLGAIDNVDDSLALSVAAKLLPLSDDATTRLLDRAATTGYVAGERVSARLELARALLAAGKADAALVSIDSAIGEARSDGEIPSLVAKALELRWEVTNDEADFEQAQEAIRALPEGEHWRELASLLIDHGDYDSANAVLEPWLERGDAAARLLAIDSYLRSGKTESAKELLKRIDKAAVPNDLKFPYAYTTGLVAGVSGDPEIRQEAIALLSGLHVPPYMTRVVEQILHALRGETSDTRSVLERVRHLLTRKT